VPARGGRPLLAENEFAELAAPAGFAVEDARELDWSWQVPDLETALRGLLSPGLSTPAIEATGEARVSDALTSALAPHRLAGGAYRIENTVQFFLATAR
jgi:hypothetical protein